MFLKTIDTISLHIPRSYFHLSKNHHDQHRANNELCNEIFLLPATKPREVKGACYPAIILKYFPVSPNENEKVRCVCGGGGDSTAEKIGTDHYKSSVKTIIQ